MKNLLLKNHDSFGHDIYVKFSSRKWSSSHTIVFLTLLFLLNLIFGSKAFAIFSARDGLPEVSYRSTNAAIQGQLNSLSSEVLSSQYPNLQWPSNPVITVSNDFTSETRSSLSTGIRLLRVGPRSDSTLLNSFKISFVMVGTNRRQLPPAQPRARGRQAAAVPTLPDSPIGERDLIRIDRESGIEFPDVAEGFPMVGVCKFEGRRGDDSGYGGGIESPFGGPSHTMQTSRSRVIAYESNFFALAPDISVEDYLNVVCIRSFREQIEPQLIRQLESYARSRSAQANWERTGGCRAEVDDGEDNDGDSQCIEWMYRSYPTPLNRDRSVAQRRTSEVRYVQRMLRHKVPRCVRQASVVVAEGHQFQYKCELRSRSGGRCPLYYNSRTQRIQSTHAGYYSEITPGNPFGAGQIIEAGCDEGTSCRLQGPEWSALMFRNGTGRCVRNPTRTAMRAGPDQ